MKITLSKEELQTALMEWAHKQGFKARAMTIRLKRDEDNYIVFSHIELDVERDMNKCLSKWVNYDGIGARRGSA
jgi:hypothetical protein